MNKNIVILILLLFWGLTLVFSQEEGSGTLENQEESTVDSARSNSDEDDSNTDSQITTEGDSASQEKAPREISSEEKAIVQSIKVSSDYDLLLWVRGLGIDSSNDRGSLEQALMEYYGIPLEAMRKKEQPVQAEQTTSTEEKKEEEDAEKKLVDVEVIEDNTIAEGTADEIIIKTANSARYFTYEKVEEDVFILQGNVEVVINQKREKRQHVIIADKLVYNESTRNGAAIGDVSYKVYEYTTTPSENFSGQTTIEEFDSQVVSFNIDDFNADVLIGNTRTEKEVRYGKKKSLSDKLLFRIYSPHLSRSKDNVITVTNASFTSSKAVPPIYRIKLKKMWLLNPEEWAISNASVYLGEIPLMWLPFFVNPGDKFFFNPSIGLKTRTGGYINTTTYLIGSHDAAKDGEEFLNLFNFSKQKAKKKIIKGLYLREAEPGDKIVTYPSGWLLRYLLDYYTGLGGYTAIEGKFPKLWVLNKFDFDLGFALTQTVYNRDQTYFNYYVKDGKFERHFDNGYLFNQSVPFRLKFKFSTAMDISEYNNTSINFEMYTDSFLDRDFSQRSFDFSWDQILDPNRKLEELNQRSSQKSSYYWQWNNSIRIPASKLVGNYIQSLSISNLKVQADWARKKLLQDGIPEEYSSSFGSVEQEIESYFFYPSKIELPSYQANMSGTLFSLDTKNLNFRNGIPMSEKRKKAQEEKEQEKLKKEEQERLERYPNLPAYTISPPVEIQSLPEEPPKEEGQLQFPEYNPSGVTRLSFMWDKLTYNLGYSISHTLNEIIYYKSEKFIKVSDVDITDKNFINYAYLTTNYNFSVNNNISVLDSWLTYAYTVVLDMKYQYLNFEDNLTEAEVKSRKDSAENYTTENLSNTNSLNFYPLKWLVPMSSSAITYTTNFDLGKNVFGTHEEAEWFDQEDKEWWNQHKISQLYNFTYASTSQNAKLDVDLPPFDVSYAPAYDFSMKYLSFSISTRIVEHKDNKSLQYDPLATNINLNFFDNKLSLQNSISYKYDEDYVQSVNTTFKAWWYTTSLSTEYSPKYEFDRDAFSFVSPNIYDKELRLKTWNNNLSYSSTPFYFWKDRINLSFNTNTTFNYDFVRFINTSFSWSYGVNFAVHKYLTLKFSTSLKNDVVYTYFDEFANQIGIDTRNIWDDIGNGLSVWDESQLRQSAFKLGTINASAVQDFGGWVFSFTYSGSPQRVTTNNITNYQWKNVIELSVYWKPLPEFKSEAFYRKDAWSLEEEVRQ